VNYLLDTCAVAEFVRDEPDPTFLEWLDSCDEDRLHISVLTLGEIQKGVAKLPRSKRKEMLRRWLHDDLVGRFTGRILPVTQDVALMWGRLQGDAERRGRKLPAIDALIAATALVFGGVVVTRDQEHLKRCDVPVLAPWSS